MDDVLIASPAAQDALYGIAAVRAGQVFCDLVPPLHPIKGGFETNG